VQRVAEDGVRGGLAEADGEAGRDKFGNLAPNSIDSLLTRDLFKN
jgi:hypothetical protein